MSVSAEVAADFRDALQDLKVNSRPEISNLTIIAKENTEHAQAISRELENHIRTTRPEWKLPALYVLDSIVKNVGTPYTVYLSRNLYKTFMEAWSLVDEGTRKSMEGLLRTWKQPVPESMDPRPVFAAQVTRDIENTLIKYRTAAVQQAHQTQRPPLHHNVPGRPMPNVPWRNTPTPPQNVARYPPNDPRVRQAFAPQSFGGQYPPQGAPPNSFQAPPVGYPQRSPSVDLDTIRSDLDRLIVATTSDFAGNLSDVSVQQKLKALLDLQNILKTQTLAAEQLRQIRTQIQQLSPPQAPPSSHTPSFPHVPPVIPSPVQAAPPSFSPAPNALNLAQILAASAKPPVQPSPAPASTTLADLLRTTSPMQASGTPVAAAPLFPNSFSTIPPPSVPTPTPGSGATGAAPSLAQLLKQYSKPAAAPTPPVPSASSVPLPQFPPQPPPPAGTPVGSADWLLAALKSQNLIPPLPPVPGNLPVSSTPMARIPSGVANVPNDVVLTTASMKQPRPHLISKLYDAFPNQCVTCGRRFENTAEGKQRKARHMDWHFKVKDPDMAKRGVHRSWYIGEREWIDYTEVDETAPETTVNGASGGKGASAAPKQEAKDKYVAVPTDPALVRNPCPICQEKFEPQWLVEANDFVWMDAVAVGGKIYHATCWEEYSKGVGSSADRPSTPDVVLGKRKAEVSPMSSGKKIRAF